MIVSTPKATMPRYSVHLLMTHDQRITKGPERKRTTKRSASSERVREKRNHKRIREFFFWWSSHLLPVLSSTLLSGNGLWWKHVENHSIIKWSLETFEKSLNYYGRPTKEMVKRVSSLLLPIAQSFQHFKIIDWIAPQIFHQLPSQAQCKEETMQRRKQI